MSDRNIPCLDGTLEGHEYTVERDGKLFCSNCGKPKKYKRVDQKQDKKFVEFLHKQKGEKKVQRMLEEEYPKIETEE